MATRFWVLSNEDSKARFFRQRHVENNGGTWEFSPKGGWVWKKEEVKVVKEEVIEEKPKAKKRFFKKDSE